MVLVFIYCVWVGRRFAHRRTGHWLTFFFFPVLFSVVAIFSLLLSTKANVLGYCTSLWGGFSLGLFMTNRVLIKIDVACQTISAPGSWSLMVCLMALFLSKCVVDFWVVLTPEYAVYFKKISWIVKGIVTGILYGQAVSFWYRFSIAASSDVSELTRERFIFFSGLKKISLDCYSRLLKNHYDGCANTTKKEERANAFLLP